MWEDRPDQIEKAEASVEGLQAIYKNNDLGDPERIGRQKETKKVERRSKLRGLSTYLEKDIFDDDDTTINITADELSEWQATILQADKKVVNPI